MATTRVARRVVRCGRIVYLGGGFIGATLWLVRFSGDLHLLAMFYMPLLVGLAITSVGRKLERTAQQPDVGRQMRQP
jgi:hypothetical protein